MGLAYHSGCRSRCALPWCREVRPTWIQDGPSWLFSHLLYQRTSPSLALWGITSRSISNIVLTPETHLLGEHASLGIVHVQRSWCSQRGQGSHHLGPGFHRTWRQFTAGGTQLVRSHRDNYFGACLALVHW